jgi:hypothetical protein
MGCYKKGSDAYGTFGLPLVKAAFTMGEWRAKLDAGAPLARGEA